MSIRETGEVQECKCAAGESAGTRQQRRRRGLAVIPDYRGENDSEREYRDFPEEKIWSPRIDVNGWVPFYVLMARSALTLAQEGQGIPNREAMENSCTGEAEQYITDVLHRSEYIPEVALKTLLVNELPEKVLTNWTSADSELFIAGITQYGKNFTDIQKNMLPHKPMKDIVDFYYKWKRTEAGRDSRDCRRRRRSAKGKHGVSRFGDIIGDPASSKMVTRSVSASWKGRDSQSRSPRDTSLALRKRKRNSFCVS